MNTLRSLLREYYPAALPPWPRSGPTLPAGMRWRVEPSTGPGIHRAAIPGAPQGPR
ncbi:MAG TPA: hypothetical protein VIQ76_10765 [Propionibacteriaceae bacterium]